MKEPTEAQLLNLYRNLEQRVRTLEGGRPGRKPKPIVVSEAGVCGVDPERDSACCEDASLYRKQRGCKGDACMRIAAEYYDNYRNKATK